MRCVLRLGPRLKNSLRGGQRGPEDRGLDGAVLHHKGTSRPQHSSWLTPSSHPQVVLPHWVCGCDEAPTARSPVLSETPPTSTVRWRSSTGAATLKNKMRVRMWVILWWRTAPSNPRSSAPRCPPVVSVSRRPARPASRSAVALPWRRCARPAPPRGAPLRTGSFDTKGDPSSTIRPVASARPALRQSVPLPHAHGRPRSRPRQPHPHLRPSPHATPPHPSPGMADVGQRKARLEQQCLRLIATGRKQIGEAAGLTSKQTRGTVADVTTRITAR